MPTKALRPKSKAFIDKVASHVLLALQLCLQLLPAGNQFIMFQKDKGKKIKTGCCEEMIPSDVYRAGGDQPPGNVCLGCMAVIAHT